MLTIAVPTYNRNNKLLLQLERLLAQIDGWNLELLVVDNCSPDSVQEFVWKSLAKHPQFHAIRVVRNPANIGLGANLLRCIELAQGEWVWLLGDDDPVMPESVAVTHAAINQADDQTFMIKTGCKRTEALTYNNNSASRVVTFNELLDLSKDADFFSNLLHVSSSIFHRPKALAYLNYGYHWNYSCAPHLAILFAALRDKCKVLLYEPAQITSGGYDQRSWSLWRFHLGLATFIELDGCDHVMRRWLQTVFCSWYRRKWITSILAVILRDSTRSPDYWRAFCFRLASVSSAWRSFWLVSIALIICPVLGVKHVRVLAQRLFGQRQEQSAIDRS